MLPPVNGNKSLLVALTWLLVEKLGIDPALAEPINAVLGGMLALALSHKFFKSIKK
jgi:hypothetical protein